MNEESCDEDCESYLLCELYNSTVLLKGIKGGCRLSQLMADMRQHKAASNSLKWRVK